LLSAPGKEQWKETLDTVSVARRKRGDFSGEEYAEPQPGTSKKREKPRAKDLSQREPIQAILMENSSAFLRATILDDCAAVADSDPAAPEGSKESERPTPIILTSTGNSISFQEKMKPIPWQQFSLRTMGARGIHFLTHGMTFYKAMLSYLTKHNLRHFPYCKKSDKPKAVIRVLPLYISSKDITPLLKNLGFDIMSVKQTTFSHLSAIISVFLPFA
jgi:hypothetical protein